MGLWRRLIAMTRGTAKASREILECQAKGKQTPLIEAQEERREAAIKFYDEGVAADEQGDREGARKKWLAATEADSTWSAPYFELAYSFMRARAFDEAERYLEKAEARAKAGSSLEDSRVLSQAKLIRRQIPLERELARRGLLKRHGDDATKPAAEEAY